MSFNKPNELPLLIVRPGKDENGVPIEPAELPIGPKNDGGNPNIADVADFGNGPTFNKNKK